MADIHIKKIETLHLKLAAERGQESTYCPSEIARAYDPLQWREYMDAVRHVADSLVKDGTLVVMQSGELISELPSKAKGPIRLRKK